MGYLVFGLTVGLVLGVIICLSFFLFLCPDNLFIYLFIEKSKKINLNTPFPKTLDRPWVDEVVASPSAIPCTAHVLRDVIHNSNLRKIAYEHARKFYESYDNATLAPVTPKK